MSDNYVEKNFLYLLVLSVLLHLAVYQLFQLIPEQKSKPEPQTTMVDLTELPKVPEPQVVRPELPEKKQPVQRHAERRQRVAREIAPKGEAERALPRLTRPAFPVPARPQAPVRPDTAAPALRQSEPGKAAPQERVAEPVPRGEGIFRPKASGEATSAPKLFPSATRMAKLEESYRKKYGPEVEDGEAMFLNTDDIRFGSFLRRLETAIYGVWQYPQAALQRGIEGTTPVRITFNRKGEITHVEILESSGSGILDNEVLRTLKQIGPVGSFPKGYSRDDFKLIAFFHYGIGGNRLR